MWVEIEEEEQKGSGDATSGPMSVWSILHSARITFILQIYEEAPEKTRVRTNKCAEKKLRTISMKHDR